jgi:general secretion pathway protein H
VNANPQYGGWRTLPQGFTLLEILVVVMLIGISITVVGLSLGRDHDRVAELEARRFAALLEHLRDESVLSGRSYAILVDEPTRSYRFLAAGSGWKPVTGDDILRDRMLPDFLKLRLDLPAGSSESDAGLVVVEALGDITPFVLTVSGDDQDFRVTLDAAQNLVVRGHARDTG